MALMNEKLEALKSRIESVEKKRVFFLSGMPKSGTTWVERILDFHPNVVCKGEAHFGILLEPAVRHAVSIYNARIQKKGNWSRQRKEIPDGAALPLFTYSSKDLDYLLAEAIKLMLVKWVNSENVQCIGDKTPQNLAYLPLFERIYPSARYVYIIRDVRDVTVSAWFFNLALDQKFTLEHYANLKNFCSITAKAWARDVSRAKAYARVLNERYCEIQYEKLWRDPEREVARLFDFVQVSNTKDVIADCLRLTEFSRLSRGRARGTENRSSFYRKGIIGDWENHLDQAMVDEIHYHCGSLMKEMGYE